MQTSPLEFTTYIIFSVIVWNRKANKNRCFFLGQSEYFLHIFVLSIIFTILKPKCKAAIWKTNALNPPQICSGFNFFFPTAKYSAKEKKKKKASIKWCCTIIKSSFSGNKEWCLYRTLLSTGGETNGSGHRMCTFSAGLQEHFQHFRELIQHLELEYFRYGVLRKAVADDTVK